MTAKIKSLTDLRSVRDYLSRIGAEDRSLKTAVVRESHGTYWKDIVVIKFAKDGEVICPSSEHAPTDLERAQIKAEWLTVQWPELKRIPNLMNLPPELDKARPNKDLFIFRDEQNMIVMLQHRIELKGEKKYVPWTYWSDDMWRRCEPDGPLPLYNAEKLKNAATVFIHEGAKAARHVQWMVDGETREARDALAAHPWGQEMAHSVHLGWIGGALSPYRTDWSVLQRAGVTHAYIVADNDVPGRTAVPAISQQLRCPTYMIQFTDEFPASFDLADEFPRSMFGKGEHAGFYIGPTFRDCLHPATWATDLLPNPGGKGRSMASLRDSFKGMWSYVETIDMFVCNDMPDIIRSEQVLNKMLAPFSHAAETCRLILKAYQGRSVRVCYRPDVAGVTVTARGSSAINLHVPPRIRAKSGDTTPWEEFLAYLFVNESERKEAERWLATLIARPDLRMGYGMLLVSEKQGVGKTTLGGHILAPLVGYWNVSYPSEEDINAPFNSWVANKRLAIVSEIYSGSSWKAYHKLKSVITDADIHVNEKYQRPYTIENWCHIFASSNSLRALKMENDDRRWYYPEVTEKPWPMARFAVLRQWIEGGGLRVIKAWAEAYGDYVMPNERAPMTERKRELIEGSRSEAQREAAAIAEAIKDLAKPGAVTIKDVVMWCRQNVQGRVFDSDYELRRAMVEAGLIPLSRRIKIGQRMEYVLVNAEMFDIIRESENQAVENDKLRSHIVKCSELMDQLM